MSIIPALHKFDLGSKVGTKAFGSDTDVAWDLFKPKTPPPAPGVPSSNDAMNAAQSQTDAMRMRRGLLANIYAGNSNTAPVTGKTQLGI
jgi:hypothetical protein